MKRALVIGAVALTAAGVASANEQSFDFSGFDAISVGEGVEAVIAVGGEFSVRAEGTAEALERLDVKIKKGELNIGRKSKLMNRGKAPRVVVNVTLPALNSLDVSTGSETTVTGVAATNFSMDASTGAVAKVSGQCETLSLDVSTGAEVEARELQCKTASVDASTGGTATIFASEQVSGDAAFGGEVSVYGSPSQVSKDTSFGGEISIE